ncbi:MAG: DUF4397 domain-containing protein [Chitinophagia bacterium]|nr:DUF4397 domain-containing protein [Chitinophagia bacterium]
MKKSLQHILLGASVLVLGLVACNKEITYLADPVSTSTNAYVKFVHEAPNLATITGQTDNITVLRYNWATMTYDKLTGTAITYDKTFPTTTNAYVSIPAGPQTFKFSLAAVSQKDSAELFLKSVQTDPGKYYSFIVTDSVKASSASKAIFLQDDLLTLDVATQIGMRFVHAIWNDTAASTVDIFSTRNNRVIFAAKGAGSASSFSALNYYSTNDTLIVRRSGTTNELARMNGVGFTPGRNYTLVYKGNGTVTSSTGKPRSLMVYGH